MARRYEQKTLRLILDFCTVLLFKLILWLWGYLASLLRYYFAVCYPVSQHVIDPASHTVQQFEELAMYTCLLRH